MSYFLVVDSTLGCVIGLLLICCKHPWYLSSYLAEMGPTRHSDNSSYSTMCTPCYQHLYYRHTTKIGERFACHFSSKWLQFSCCGVVEATDWAIYNYQ